MKYLETEGAASPLLLPAARSALIAAFRGTRLACHILYGLAQAMAFPILGAATRQRLMLGWSRSLLQILHVRLETSGTLPQPGGPGVLLIANHISWLDVFVIGAASPACFVAKSEVRSWPLIGLLCRLTRTQFIERNLKRDTLRANATLTSTLSKGECVALFPEGTSTDGSQVRHFHAPLLQCAIDAGTWVQPIAIRYHNGSGLRVDDACYIDDMSLVQSLLRIMRCCSLHARLVFLPKLSSQEKTRRMLADEAHAAISSTLSSEDAHPCATASHAAMQIAHPGTTSAGQSAYSLLLDPSIGKLRQPRRL